MCYKNEHILLGNKYFTSLSYGKICNFELTYFTIMDSIFFIRKTDLGLAPNSEASLKHSYR